ncbi:uncharacterized protein LOC133203068 [Saccostrea echinata]|uniref:uncharacterized protein LOC133203068 n=1 Tax=Saccostrea echinata TaxID=191078 RepID=UPI002A7F89BC|nr:uncharacterized protein LOC133203068 [Saccostrea echinata]
MDLGFENGQRYWREQAFLDAKRNRELRHQHGNGPCNIFILDTSSSLGEEGFNQMKDIFCTIINEYANHPEEDENVAVIVCGKNTRFQHYFSNQYLDIAQSLDGIEYGGLSPLTAAFLLCIESTRNGASHTLKICDFVIRPRIILISDGRPTNFHFISDTSDSIQYETEEVFAKNQLQQITRLIGRRNPIFCIPVGENPDLIFFNTFKPLLEFICALSRGGKLVYPFEARQFARYSQNMEDILELSRKKSLFTSASEHSDSDEDVIDIVLEKKDPCMPDLGSRVKRGPDWMWENQDGYGPGTVIGFGKKVGWLWIEWDNGDKNKYRYGNIHFVSGVHDVVVCDLPRVLEDELIAVGCLVVRGPDWKWGDQDGGEGNIGSVFRVRNNGSVNVRWRNGNVRDYRFGYKGTFDLLICDPFSRKVREYLQENVKEASTTESSNREHTFLKRDFHPDIDSKSKSLGLEQSVHDFSRNCTHLLKVPKGKYFRNDKLEDESSSDLEVDGQKAINQWMWKDNSGKWNNYPRKMNDKIYKSWKRNPNSTVVVEINECVYRVVLERNIQINLETKERMEIELIE